MGRARASPHLAYLHIPMHTENEPLLTLLSTLAYNGRMRCARTGVLCVVAWLALPMLARTTLGQDIEEDDLQQEIASLLDLIGAGGTMTESELKARVEQIGGLRLLRPLPVKFMDKAELKKYLQEVFDQEYPVEKAAAEESLLKFLGFIPPSYELRRERMQLLYENIAGFYNERAGSKALYAVSSKSKIDFLNGLILAHEIRHAIQDQHFNLEQRLPALSDFDDRRLAPLALYEGDATVVMMRFVSGAADGAAAAGGEDDIFGMIGSGSGFDLGSIVEMASSMAGATYAAAPEILKRQLLLPYVEGARFIEAIEARGGRAAVDRALGAPPQSSEQIMHPEKYLVPDAPVDMQFKTPPQLAQLAVLTEGTLGEFYMQSLFAGATGINAAAGWDGDYFRLYRDAQGRRTLLWKSAWDSERDAAEFCAAWAARARTTLTGSASVLDGKDIDGTPIRLIRAGSTVKIIKSDDPAITSAFTAQN